MIHAILPEYFLCLLFFRLQDQANKTVTKTDMMWKAEANKIHWDKIVTSNEAIKNNSYESSFPGRHSSRGKNITKPDTVYGSFMSQNDGDNSPPPTAKKSKYVIDTGGTILSQSSGDSGVTNVCTKADLARSISTSVSRTDLLPKTMSLLSCASSHPMSHDVFQDSAGSDGLNSLNNEQLQENGGHYEANRPMSCSFPCVLHALTWATQRRDPGVKVKDPLATLPEVPKALVDADHIQILVTGSLHLVGAVLAVLEPEMND